MKFLSKQIKKASIIISSILLVVIVVSLFFISQATKYVIEKYDVKYTGREIKLDGVYINIFTGYIHFSKLKIYEANSDSVFFSADEVNANIALHRLMYKTLELSEVTLVKPIGVISQNKKTFNFDGLIKKFTPTNTGVSNNTQSFFVNILNIKIEEGTVYYYEKTIPVTYWLKQINIESPGKLCNNDTMKAKFSWLSGIGSGAMKGDIRMNVKSLDYTFSLLASKFDLSVMEQYLKEISNNGSLRGNFDADIKASGNFLNAQNIDAKGLLTLNNFHFGKSKIEDYLSFKKFTISANELSPKNKKYLFDSLALTEPYFKYELYDHLDNLQYMFGKKGEKVSAVNAKSVNTNFLFEIADYVKALAKNFFKSNYKLNKLAIYKANLTFVDYTLNEKFEASAKSLCVFADSIERSNKWVNLTIRTDVKPYGKGSLDLSINPKDSSDFSIKYNVQQLPAAMFNPYLTTYTSFPLNRGTIELDGTWQVNNGIIKSDNHLVIIDPRTSKREKRWGNRWIPLRLVMFFVRDRENVIDCHIPIIGNLKDPKFKFRDVFINALTNLVVKPVTIPYRTQVKNVENEIEKWISLNWEMQKSNLQSHQKKFIKQLANYLNEFPEKTIGITSMPFMEKEKEYILFFEAKKLYYLFKNKLNTNLLTIDDTLAIDKLSTRDSLFAGYLTTQVGKKDMYTIQDKCLKLVGLDKVDKLFYKLTCDRRKTFMAYFIKEHIGNRVRFKEVTDKTPYNGFSFYKIEYQGEWPKKLENAYKIMAELNSESPRSKFSSERAKEQN